MRSILMCIARMLSAFWKSSRIFIILLLRCNLCAEIVLTFATHSLYFFHRWFHWSLWYCVIAMLSLVEIIVKKKMRRLRLDCIFASSWMKTFRSIIFLMMSKREMTRLTFVKRACISLHACLISCIQSLTQLCSVILFCSMFRWTCSELCMFLSLKFRCLLFWMLLLHDVESDSEVFLVCILCSTIHLSCRADVRLTLRMQFLISLLLSILVLLLWR